MTVICARGRNKKRLGMFSQKPQRKKDIWMPRHRWKELVENECVNGSLNTTIFGNISENQLHVSAPYWVGHHQVETRNNRENHTNIFVLRLSYTHSFSTSFGSHNEDDATQDILEDITERPCLYIYKQLLSYRRNVRFRRHSVMARTAFKCLRIELDGWILTNYKLLTALCYNINLLNWQPSKYKTQFTQPYCFTTRQGLFFLLTKKSWELKLVGS
jgi:hypothetical protein